MSHDPAPERVPCQQGVGGGEWGVRRTARTEFNDARSASNEARKAMLERVGLRQSDPEPEPRPVCYESVGDGISAQERESIQDTINWMLDQIYRESGGAVSVGTAWEAPRSDLLADIQQAAQLVSRYNSNPFRTVGYARGGVIQGPQRWPYEPQPQTGLMPDAYYGGQRSSVHAMYDPITWPDEGYPCQLCWAVKRWPWEPMRSCPITVDVESTYCEKHGGKAKETPTLTWVKGDGIADMSAPTLAELSSGSVYANYGLLNTITHTYWASASNANRIFTGIVP